MLIAPDVKPCIPCTCARWSVRRAAVLLHRTAAGADACAPACSSYVELALAEHNIKASSSAAAALLVFVLLHVSACPNISLH